MFLKNPLIKSYFIFKLILIFEIFLFILNIYNKIYLLILINFNFQILPYQYEIFNNLNFEIIKNL